MQILKEKDGKARFGFVYGRLAITYDLTKKTLWDYLDALKAAGKIDYDQIYITGQENEVNIKLLEAERQEKKEE